MRPLRALVSLVFALAVLSVLTLGALAGVGVAAHLAWIGVLTGWQWLS